MRRATDRAVSDGISIIPPEEPDEYVERIVAVAERVFAEGRSCSREFVWGMLVGAALGTGTTVLAAAAVMSSVPR